MVSLREYKNPIVVICLGILAGTSFYFKNIHFYYLIAIFIFAFVYSLFNKNKILLMLSLSFIAGYFYTISYLRVFNVNLDYLLNKKNIYIGEIISFDNDNSLFYKKYFLKLKYFIKDQSCVDLSDIKIQVLGTHYEEYSPGDLIEITGVLKKPKTAVLPGLFDEKRFLQIKGVNYILKADPSTLVFLDEPVQNIFIRLVNKLRNKLIMVNARNLPKENADLVNGIVFGSKASNLKGLLKETIQDLGLSHITSASGFNVSILAAGIFYISRFLIKGIGGKLTPTIVSIFAVLIYSSICDFSASIIRATVFIVFVLVGNLFDKKLKILPGVSLIVLLFFLFNPVNILDVGLQLSILAFLGITLYAGGFKTFNLFFQSLFAQIMVIPLIVFYFHNVQLLGIVANLIAVPLASVILILGLINILFAKLAFLQLFVLVLLRVFSDFFLQWVDYLYKFPFKQIFLPNINFYFLILIYIFLLYALSSVFIISLRKKYKEVIALLIAAFLFVYIATDTSKYLKIYCFPKYNKDSILVIPPYDKPVYFANKVKEGDIYDVRYFLRLNNIKSDFIYYDLGKDSGQNFSNKLLVINQSKIILKYKNFVFHVVRNYSEKIKPEGKYLKLPILRKKDPTFNTIFSSLPEELIINDYKKLSKKSYKNIEWLNGIKKQNFKTYFLSETGTITLITDGLSDKLYFSGF